LVVKAIDRARVSCSSNAELLEETLEHAERELAKDERQKEDEIDPADHWKSGFDQHDASDSD
jgi:hypothetical protein